METLVQTRALSELKTGEAGRVTRITAKNPVRHRILAEERISMSDKIDRVTNRYLGIPI